jgi:translation initiation factor 4E
MSQTTSLDTTNQQDSQINDQKSHALHYGWVFWFMHRSPGQKITNYESAMKKIATFNTVMNDK